MEHTRSSYRNKKAFTLTELITVVIVIGIMAAFAIPNYSASVEKAHRRDATNNLIAIHGANQIYQAEKGAYWPSSGTQDLTAINTNLRLSIIPNGMEYTCEGNGTTYTCTSCRPNCSAVEYKVSVTQAPISSSNPSVSGT